MSDVRALEERAPLARLRARLGRVNWARLNYVLIPSARSRRPVPHPVGEPASATASRIWSFYRSFTREGRALFVATLITAAFAVDVTHTQVYVLFAVLGSALLASLVVSRWLGLP